MAQSHKRNRKRPCIQLSGFNTKDKQALQAKIEGLGATMPDTNSFRVESTHIVMKTLSRSEKYLGGCATGKWVLTRQFLEESHHHGHWLDEAAYEWSMKMAGNVQDPESIALLKAPSRWRQRIAEGSSKPFTGWKTAVVVENSQRKSIYKRLLSVGGAQVSELSLPITRPKDVAAALTHIIVDQKQSHCTDPVARRGVLCVDPVYIGDFLTKEPKPDPCHYLVGQPFPDLPEKAQAAIKRSSERLLTGYDGPPTPDSSASRSSTPSSLQDFDLSSSGQNSHQGKARPAVVQKTTQTPSTSHTSRAAGPAPRSPLPTKPPLSFVVKPGTPRRSTRSSVESHHQKNKPCPAKSEPQSSVSKAVVMVNRVSQESPVKVVPAGSGYKVSPQARARLDLNAQFEATSVKLLTQSKEITNSQHNSSNELPNYLPIAPADSPGSSQGSGRVPKVSLQRLSQREIIDLVSRSCGASSSRPESHSSQKSVSSTKRCKSPLPRSGKASDASLLGTSFNSTTPVATTTVRRSRRGISQQLALDKEAGKLLSTTPRQVQHKKRQMPVKKASIEKGPSKQMSILSMFTRISSPAQPVPQATESVCVPEPVPQKEPQTVSQAISKADKRIASKPAPVKEAAKIDKLRVSVEVDFLQEMDQPLPKSLQVVTEFNKQAQVPKLYPQIQKSLVPETETNDKEADRTIDEGTQAQLPVEKANSIHSETSSSATIIMEDPIAMIPSPQTLEKYFASKGLEDIDSEVWDHVQSSTAVSGPATAPPAVPLPASLPGAVPVTPPALGPLTAAVAVSVPAMPAAVPAVPPTVMPVSTSAKAVSGLPETVIQESAKRKLNMSDQDDCTSITRPSASGSVIKFYKSPPHKPVSSVLSPTHKEAPPLSQKRGGAKRKLAMDDTLPKLKRMKMYHVTNNLPWTPFHDLPLLSDDCTAQMQSFPQSVSYQMSDPMTGIFDTCVDENRQCFGLDVLLSMTSSRRYPQPKTINTLMTIILQPSLEVYLSHRTYGCLRQILTQHPPTSPALQQLYLEAMRDPLQNEPSNNEEWEFLESVISQSMVTMDDVEETEAEQYLRNNFFILQFLVAVFEKDFQVFMLNLKNQSPSELTPHRLPLIHRVMWSHGGAATMNHQCRSLISYLVDAIRSQKPYRLTMVYMMQSLVAMVGTCMKVNKADLGYTVDDLDLPREVLLFSKEMAYRVGAELDDVQHLDDLFRTLQLPWLAVKIVQTILDTYEVFMPLELPEEDTLTLKLIVAKYFYLLPPIVQNGTLVSPTKRVLTPIQENEVSKSRRYKVNSRVTRTRLNSSIGKPIPSTTPTKGINVKPSPIKQRQMFRVNKRNAAGETPLMVACKQKNVTKVKELLTIPGIEVNAADYAGWTALHEACNHGHLECVQELLKYRPHRTIASYFNTGGAMEQGGKVNLLAVNGDGITPLHDAIMNGHVQVAQLLLQYGGKVLLNATTRLGYTPPQLAESKEMLEMLENFCKSTTPTSRKRPLGMSQEEFLNCSHNSSLGSQGSFNESATVTYQPPPESYDTILGTGDDQCHVPEAEGLRYVLFIFYLLKHYLSVKEYGTTKAMLKSGVGITSEMLRSLSNKAFNSSLSQFSSAKNNPSAPGKLPKFPLPSTSRKFSWKELGEDYELLKDPPTPEKLRAELKDELGVLRRLEMHIAAFESHITNVSRNKQFDWSKSKMNCLKIIAK